MINLALTFPISSSSPFLLLCLMLQRVSSTCPVTSKEIESKGHTPQLEHPQLEHDPLQEQDWQEQGSIVDDWSKNKIVSMFFCPY